MIYLVSSIYDRRSKSFSFPTCSVNKEVLLRNTKILVTDGQTLISKYPEDFDLYVLGTFDSDTGVIDYKVECLGSLGGESNVLCDKK